MATTLVLVKRNHHAFAPKDQLDVEDSPGKLRLKEVHPLPCRRRMQPSCRVLDGQVRQDVARVLFVQARLQAGQLSARLQRELDLAGSRELSDTRQDFARLASHGRPLITFWFIMHMVI